MKMLAALLVLALMVIAGWTLYSNVFADDAALRIDAEKVAREAAGCPKCARTRFEGASSILGKTYTFTFDKTGAIAISCRRPYIAFGAFACTRK